MRKCSFGLLVGVVLFVACNSATKPSDANFRKAIDVYLAKHGRACTWLGRPFPIDISDSELRAQFGTGLKMAVLERLGLVHSSDATALAPAILGAGTPHHVKRYEPTDAGKRFVQTALGAMGQTAGFCYGEKVVDSVVKWTQPVTSGAASEVEVTYTYTIHDLAPWTEQPDVQNAFGDIRSTINGISKSNEIVGLQLTNHEWEVPER